MGILPLDGATLLAVAQSTTTYTNTQNENKRYRDTDIPPSTLERGSPVEPRLAPTIHRLPLPILTGFLKRSLKFDSHELGLCLRCQCPLRQCLAKSV